MKLQLSKEDKGIFRKPWRQTLIIKLLSRSIGYKILFQIITSLWKPKATIDHMAMDNRFFLVKFATLEDNGIAKYNGPWMIFNHYLTV